jgi:hypothetical protein
MKYVLFAVFSLYLLVGAFYSLYGDYYACCECEIPIREVIFRAVWHISKGGLLAVISFFLVYSTFDITLRKICLITGSFEALRVIYYIFNILGVVTIGDELWCGFSVFIIFVMALILFIDE